MIDENDLERLSHVLNCCLTFGMIINSFGYDLEENLIVHLKKPIFIGDHLVNTEKCVLKIPLEIINSNVDIYKWIENYKNQVLMEFLK